MYAPAVEFATTAHGLRRRRARPRLQRAVAALAAVAALVLLGFARAAHGEPAAAYETVVVHPGDTLWKIAAEHYPDADVRQKIDDIESANGLGGPEIWAGQRLRVPAN